MVDWRWRGNLLYNDLCITFLQVSVSPTFASQLNIDYTSGVMSCFKKSIAHQKQLRFVQVYQLGIRARWPYLTTVLSFKGQSWGWGGFRNSTNNSPPDVEEYISARVDQLLFFWGWETSHLQKGILIMGPYKPLRDWVHDHPLLYGNNGSLDPSTYTLPETNIAPENGSSQKETIVFQPSILWCELDDHSWFFHSWFFMGPLCLKDLDGSLSLQRCHQEIDHWTLRIYGLFLVPPPLSPL